MENKPKRSGRKVFSKEKEDYWVCKECSYFHRGEHAPEDCPYITKEKIVDGVKKNDKRKTGSV